MTKKPEQPLHALPRAMHEQRRRVVTRVTQPSMAKQAFKAECDINTIVRGFERNGVVSHVNRYEGNFGDFSETPEDYQAALHAVMEAQDSFNRLPARLRAHFQNDPARFLAFRDDPEAVDLMEKSGLLKQATPPVVEPVVQPEGENKGDGQANE